MKTNQEQFDVAVIGGGPAGLLAAGRAAELGAKVVLIEKNQNLGAKLLLTGNGRCNLTHGEFDDRKFVEKLGKNGQFLFSALSVFGPEETIKFFESRGLKTKIEKDGRVFPASDKAHDVLATLLKYLDENRVTILANKKVIGFEVKDGKIESVKLAEGADKGGAEGPEKGRADKEIFAKSFILCAGGKTYPKTGSTGDGYAWLQTMGHNIVEPKPALGPIKIKENWIGKLQGVDLKNVRISLWQAEGPDKGRAGGAEKGGAEGPDEEGNKGSYKKRAEAQGDIMFAHFGLSGPAILNLSKKAEELLANGEVILKIDLMPEMDVQNLDKKLQEDFKQNKILKNYLSEIMPRRLCELAAKFSDTPPNKKLNAITREERKKISETLKGLKLTVNGSAGFGQAMVTSGGVNLKEIDSRTMRSKIISNLFFAGEIIDLDGPTGGYNLQICWTTGWAAGKNAGKI